MFSSSDEKPIIALCTPRGSGAIAIIRISGNECLNIIEKISYLSSGKKLSEAKTHTINHGHIVENKKIIDEVLFLVMKAPKTFTGQDTVEINCHNNPFIIEKIIELSVQNGAHYAQRGEFTRRAFLNKKIDLIQAESIHDLIAAQNELELKKSVEKLHGSLSSHVKEIEDKLINILSMTETSFEFIEEEQQDIGIKEKIRKDIKSLIGKTSELISGFNQQQQIKHGIRISLIGGVNAGKSTLFNALIKKDRAIVTNIPGTTRDSVEYSLFKNGNFWTFVDTAGIRKTENKIEQMGIEKSFEEAKSSDIILLIQDSSKATSTDEQKIYDEIKSKFPEKIICVQSKIDELKTEIYGNEMQVSAKTGLGISSLLKIIDEKIQSTFKSMKSQFLLSERQHNIISELNVKLKSIENKNANRIQYELVSHHIKEMLEMISQLTGKSVEKKVMDNIFSSFCVGK